MKQRVLYLIATILTAFNLTSCITVEEFANTPEGNFQALWKIIDEHYCFLDYKKEVYGLDWGEVRNRYSNYISPSMTSSQLLEVCGRMLDELRDGHVNLYAKSDVARYWNWYEDYPRNYNDSVQLLYLGTDYKIASGLKYTILDDNIGYIRYESFTNAIGDGNISEMLNSLSICNGLIIDVRENGGGNLDYAERLAARFTNEKKLVGYITHKTGPGHSDFSTPLSIYVEPSNSIRWQKKVVVLTNRKCFSATNDFVKMMKQFPNVTILGDRTGGGSGLPFSSEIPNGWSVRFSACPMYDANMNHTEFGIEPDIYVQMKTDDLLRNRDTLIEKARELLK